MYVSPVTDSQAWETDELNISWKGDSKVRIIIIALGDQGCLGFGTWCFVHKCPFFLVGESVDSAFSNSLRNNLSYLNLHAWHHEYSGRFSEEVVKNSNCRWVGLKR